MKKALSMILAGAMLVGVLPAAAMAEACRRAFRADLGIGVTGSFGNTDPANADSIPGEVFFAVAADHGTECFRCAVPPQASRLAYKLYIADVIADHVLPCQAASSVSSSTVR